MLVCLSFVSSWVKCHVWGNFREKTWLLKNGLRGLEQEPIWCKQLRLLRKPLLEYSVQAKNHEIACKHTSKSSGTPTRKTWQPVGPRRKIGNIIYVFQPITNIKWPHGPHKRPGGFLPINQDLVNILDGTDFCFEILTFWIFQISNFQNPTIWGIWP